MSDEFSFVWLLRLLEQSYEEVARDVPGAVAALRIDRPLPADMSLQQLLISTLESGSPYWTGLAIKWVEQGFPRDSELIKALRQCSDNKAIAQSDRHKARRFAGRV
ncbi:hypothetical protein SAMN05216581_3802 [Pseudomonas asplenii]|uniref:Uncharacterized protein n=1 Tax=Pseudomonas asplenii TaxID=53407 RepID=A0A1H6P2A9_9PSED|nr:hypothetical protein [Pseudomonas fuscovaginae]SEI18827.1 hypothetical protein SAMN05216581_3802 [Pseudomonas fuscovaginae]